MPGFWKLPRHPESKHSSTRRQFVTYSLEIGAVTETVDVTSGAEAAITTADASLGNSFERRRIVELPLNANNVVGLLSLHRASHVGALTVDAPTSRTSRLTASTLTNSRTVSTSLLVGAFASV